jgi:hypothetical protein
MCTLRTWATNLNLSLPYSEATSPSHDQTPTSHIHIYITATLIGAASLNLPVVLVQSNRGREYGRTALGSKLVRVMVLRYPVQ